MPSCGSCPTRAGSTRTPPSRRWPRPIARLPSPPASCVDIRYRGITLGQQTFYSVMPGVPCRHRHARSTADRAVGRAEPAARRPSPAPAGARHRRRRRGSSASRPRRCASHSRVSCRPATSSPSRRSTPSARATWSDSGAGDEMDPVRLPVGRHLGDHRRHVDRTRRGKPGRPATTSHLPQAGDAARGRLDATRQPPPRRLPRARHDPASRATRRLARPGRPVVGPAPVGGRPGAQLLDATAHGATFADRFTGAAALVRHLRTDPALPDELLPDDWPARGHASGLRGLPHRDQATAPRRKRHDEPMR